MDLATANTADFSPLVGETLELVPPSGPAFGAVLLDVTPGPPGAGRDQFALLFVGGPTPPARQGVYEVHHPRLGSLEIFLVPLGPDHRGQRYEAVFG
jgi:hypothetical protein